MFHTIRSLSSFKASYSLAALVLLFASMAVPSPLLVAQNAPKTHRKVIVMFDPEYPAVMKNGHFEGQVRLEATVSPAGTVSKVEVKGGNPILAQCASQAVIKWKYAPAPSQTIEEVIFNFNSSIR